MKLLLKQWTYTLVVFATLTSSCSEADTNVSKDKLFVAQSLNERDLLDLSSGPAVKIYPLDMVSRDLEVVGAIKGMRSKSAPTGLISSTEIAAAVVDCLNLPIVIHFQPHHDNRFVTFPSVVGAENENHVIDLRIVSCIQQRTSGDFVASILKPKLKLADDADVQAEWALSEISGDVRPFRSLHAQTH
jgi:hypothetical protein